MLSQYLVIRHCATCYLSICVQCRVQVFMELRATGDVFNTAPVATATVSLVIVNVLRVCLVRRATSLALATLGGQIASDSAAVLWTLPSAATLLLVSKMCFSNHDIIVYAYSISVYVKILL